MKTEDKFWKWVKISLEPEWFEESKCYSEDEKSALSARSNKEVIDTACGLLQEVLDERVELVGEFEVKQAF